jgi:hypothetical protein
MTQPLKIGVLGSGPAGQTLATGFLDKNHPVMIGSRDPAKLDSWLRHTGPGAEVGSFAAAAQFGEIVVLSVLGSAAEEVIRLAGVENLSGITCRTSRIASATPSRQGAPCPGRTQLAGTASNLESDASAPCGSSVKGAGRGPRSPVAHCHWSMRLQRTVRPRLVHAAYG